MDSGNLIVEFNILHSECCNLVYARGQLVYARRRGTVRGHYYRFGQSGIFDYVSTSPPGAGDVQKALHPRVHGFGVLRCPIMEASVSVAPIPCWASKSKNR